MKRVTQEYVGGVEANVKVEKARSAESTVQGRSLMRRGVRM